MLHHERPDALCGRTMLSYCEADKGLSKYSGTHCSNVLHCSRCLEHMRFTASVSIHLLTNSNSGYAVERYLTLRFISWTIRSTQNSILFAAALELNTWSGRWHAATCSLKDTREAPPKACTMRTLHGYTNLTPIAKHMQNRYELDVWSGATTSEGLISSCWLVTKTNIKTKVDLILILTSLKSISDNTNGWWCYNKTSTFGWIL